MSQQRRAMHPCTCEKMVILLERRIQLTTSYTSWCLPVLLNYKPHCLYLHLQPSTYIYHKPTFDHWNKATYKPFWGPHPVTPSTKHFTKVYGMVVLMGPLSDDHPSRNFSRLWPGISWGKSAEDSWTWGFQTSYVKKKHTHIFLCAPINPEGFFSAQVRWNRILHPKKGCPRFRSGEELRTHPTLFRFCWSLPSGNQTWLTAKSPNLMDVSS